MFSAAGKSAVTSGYNINNSLRFRQSASALLSRTPSVSSNRRTWTWSAWVKRGSLGSLQVLFGAGLNNNTNSDELVSIYFTANDQLGHYVVETGVADRNNISTAVYRDPSAWYHIVAIYDSTQATASNRQRLFVNGVEITAWSSTSYVNQNYQPSVNSSSYPHAIGKYGFNNTRYFDGYMADINFIDGQALTPSSFGETDGTTGVWKPKRFGGSFGTNGFYLPFSDIATTSGSNAGLGKDFSGNSNYWTTNNISVTSGITYDAMVDSPTNSATGTRPAGNYCTGSPLDVSVRGSFSNANLTATCLGGGSLNAGTVRLNTFNFTQLPVKWYWESTVTNEGGGRATFGMETTAFTAQPENWTGTAGWYLRADGLTNLTGATTFTNNDVLMFAYDGNTGRFWIGKNGTWTNSGAPASGTNQNRTLTVGTEYWLLFNENTGGAGTAVCHMNYGQRPFAYTPPTGFVSVNTSNIPDSAIKKGNNYMDATLYTGNGTSQTITNAASFRPDLVWIKGRSYADFHTLFDTVRGATKSLSSNLTTAEVTRSTALTAFTSTGFTVSSDTLVNYNGQTTVAWQWQAGSSTVTNTSGSISSQVRVNTTTGFSIVTYTANGVNGATVGHGLGVAPSMIIIKDRSNASFDWSVYHTSLGATRYIFLNRTDASAVSATFWNNTAPSSTVITLGNTGFVNNNGSNLVAYCWAAIPGFSAFGSYTGNGSADGTFVYLGFRPKFIMFKRTDAVENWGIWTPLASGNGIASSNNFYLLPNSSGAQDTGQIFDTLATGFKNRDSGSFANANGGTYIYAAFAENPFKNALAR